MSKGQTQTRNETSTRNPWEPAQGNLNDILNAGRSYMNDPNQYTPTFSNDTQDAARRLGDLGRGQSTQQQVLPGLVGSATGGFGDAMSTLRQTASGSMLGEGNPYLDKVLATSRQRAADQINQQFAAAGRYGPNASNTGVLADRLGAIETDARMKNYDAERGRQLNAAGLLGEYGMKGAGLAGQLDASNKEQIGLLGAGGAAQDAIDNARRTAGIDAATRAAQLTVPIAGLGGTQETQSTTRTPTNWAGVATGLGSAAIGALTGNPMAAASSALGGWFGGNSAGSGGTFAQGWNGAPYSGGSSYLPWSSGGSWFS